MVVIIHSPNRRRKFAKLQFKPTYARAWHLRARECCSLRFLARLSPLDCLGRVLPPAWIGIAIRVLNESLELCTGKQIFGDGEIANGKNAAWRAATIGCIGENH